MAKFKCDFCSAPRPTWDYPCRTFMALGGVAESIDSWVACDKCHELMQADDWMGLAERAALTVGFGEWVAWTLHSEFRQHRTGPPKRYGTG